MLLLRSCAFLALVGSTTVAAASLEDIAIQAADAAYEAYDAHKKGTVEEGAYIAADTQAKIDARNHYDKIKETETDNMKNLNTFTEGAEAAANEAKGLADTAAKATDTTVASGHLDTARTAAKRAKYFKYMAHLAQEDDAGHNEEAAKGLVERTKTASGEAYDAVGTIERKVKDLKVAEEHRRREEEERIRREEEERIRREEEERRRREEEEERRRREEEEERIRREEEERLREIEERHLKIHPYEYKWLSITPLTTRASWGTDCVDAKAHKVKYPECFRLMAVPEVFGQVDRAIGDKKTAFASSITEKDIAACRSEACLKFITELLVSPKAKIPQGSLKNVDPAQLAEIFVRRNLLPDITPALESASDSKKYYAFLDNFSRTDFLKNHGPMIIEMMEHTHRKGNLPWPVAKISDELFQALISNPEACTKLDVLTIQDVLKGTKAKYLTPDCVANMKDFANVNVDKLNKVPENFLSKYNKELHKGLIKSLDSKMLGTFASAPEFNEAQMPGKDLDLTELKKTGTGDPGIKPAVLIGRLHGAPSTITAFFEHSTDKNLAVKRLSPSLLDSVSTENGVTALSRLSTEDLKDMPDAVLQQIMERHPFICNNMPDNRSYAGVSLTHRLCFDRMNGGAQAAVLMTAKALPNDIAAGVTKDKFEAWSYASPTKKDKEFKQSEIFENMPKERANNPKIIAKFGLDPSGTSACMALGSVEEISQFKNLSANISLRCFLMTDRSFPDDRSKLNARLKLLVPYGDIRKDAKLLEKLTVEQLGHIISGGEFCSAVDFATFGKIPTAALKAVTGKCLKQFAFLGELTEAHYQAFHADVFKAMPANLINATMINVMTGPQLASACTGNKAEGQSNVAVQFTEGIIAAMSPEKAGHITPTQWKATLPSAFKGLTGDQLKGLNAAPLAVWSYDQVHEANPSVLALLNTEQASVIGKEGPSEGALVQYLYSLPGLSEDVRNVLHPRLPPEAVTEGYWKYVLIVGAIIIVLVLVGGGVYYFMSR